MLIFKTMTKQIVKNRVFVVLLWILTVFTSVSFFFVKFSIDKNIEKLNRRMTLSENEILLENALISNTTLANVFLLSFTLLTCFVFGMFFYRFFRENKMQMGCLKAMGVKDRELAFTIVLFVIFLSFIGGVSGFLAGYPLSEVLQQSYVQSYGITDVQKGISVSDILLGIGGSILAYVAVTLMCFRTIKGKEAGVLIAGRAQYKKQGIAFRIADFCTKLVPDKKRFPFRIALRKPVAVILLFFAIVFFQVCVILGRSLNLSSQKILESQLRGHHYEYDTRLEKTESEPISETMAAYLYTECEIILDENGKVLPQEIIGFCETKDLFIPENPNGKIMEEPGRGEVYINLGIADLYRVKTGEELKVAVNGTVQSFQVAGIVSNAKTATIYCNIEDLAQILACEPEDYNGLWSKEAVALSGVTESAEQRLERLEKGAVSNRISAVINQLMGVLIGIIMLFLSLFLNFQDNRKDMDILRLMGYQSREIRKLFVDVYYPIVLVFFAVAVIPGILMAQTIQRTLSVAIQDYMPFGIEIGTVLLMFLVMNVLYGCVWLIFSVKVDSYRKHRQH